MSSSDSTDLVKSEQPCAEAVLSGHELEFTPDGQLVRWRRDNKRHPRNWPLLRRVYDISIIFFLDLFLYGVLPNLWPTS